MRIGQLDDSANAHHRMIATIFQIASKAASGFLQSPESPQEETRASGKLKRLARAYAMWWAVSLLAFTAALSFIATHKPVPTLTAGPVASKLAYYQEHKSEFDLILLGDSLTYTGLHPEFIDPELGTHSVNMAAFAHWFATQYPFIQDLIPEIPRGTRVLWSVHLYDFNDAALTVQHVYPVGLVDAIRYWSWDAPNPGLLDNVLYYNPLTRFFMQRDELRERLILRGERPLERSDMGESAVTQAKSVGGEELIHPDGRALTDGPAIVKAEFPATPEFVSMQKRPLTDTAELRNRLNEYYTGLPFVAAASPVSDNGQINSVVLALKGGGYYRIELMPEYFREKQREMARSVGHVDDNAAEKYTAPPLGAVSLKMLEAILAAFRQAGIPVTINVMEEAPWTFPNEIIRRKEARRIDDTLRPIVSQYGDSYVHVDYSSIVDADFFDYNHFNSNGIAKYTPLLLGGLRELPAFAHQHDR